MIFSAESICFSYPGHPLFHNFSCKATDGLWVRGQNGSGKTTLLRLIAHQLVPEQGKFKLDGNANYTVAPLFSDAILLAPRTVREHFAWQQKFLGKRADFIESRLEACGLLALKSSPVSALSLGQKHLLALTLLCEMPGQVLLVDEPFAHLDANAMASAHALLCAAHAAGKFIVVATTDDQTFAFKPDQVVLDHGEG